MGTEMSMCSSGREAKRGINHDPSRLILFLPFIRE